MIETNRVETQEQFEDYLADLIDHVLAHVDKNDVVASLEHMIKEVRSGGFNPSIPV